MPVLLRNASQQISTTAPVRIPATAPLKLKRFQKSDSMIVGPNAAPNTPHAFDTRPMIEAEAGSAAMRSAITATPRTTKRPTQRSSLSLALFFLIIGL